MPWYPKDFYNSVKIIKYNYIKIFIKQFFFIKSYKCQTLYNSQYSSQYSLY